MICCWRLNCSIRGMIWFDNKDVSILKFPNPHSPKTPQNRTLTPLSSGTSCESCTEGYYRVESRGYPLGECVPCDCNGHSNTCDLETGVCSDCQDNTEGDHCESCQNGFYGDPTDGQSCQICPCPLPVAGNSFGTCDYDPLTGRLLFRLYLFYLLYW